MVDIVPFKGLLFNQKKTGPAEQVTAPPYDVISPKQQDALYKKNPFNIVRLILEKQYPEDNEENNRYTRSSATFSQWIVEKILIEDEKPCFYVYSQEYTNESQSVYFTRLHSSTVVPCPGKFRVIV